MSQQTNYELFKAGYKFLFDSDRVLELPHCTLEECYPAPWTKTKEEVHAMGGLFTL